MNTVLLIAKGSKYVDLFLKYYTLIKGKADLVVYTDETFRVQNNTVNTDVREYKESVFRYFDKYKLTYELSLEKKSPILYCDVGRLDVAPYVKFFNFDSTKINSVYTNSNWEGINNSSDLYNCNSPYFEKEYFNNIVEHFINSSVDHLEVVPYLERLFIFPYKKWTFKLIEELENLRELFESNSKNKTHVYPGIGNGEGLALGYALLKTKSSHKLLRDIPILTKQPSSLI